MGDRESGSSEPIPYVPPPTRLSGVSLQEQIAVVSQNPVIDHVLESFAALLAVLNPQRQILAVNEVLLKSLHVENPRDLLGLRPGEALRCLYADDGPDGCGTGRFCSTCGAAIAMVATLATERPAERECALRASLNGRTADLYFEVRCAPVTFDGHRFLLLFLRDISAEQQRAALEKIFYHDIGNTIQSLLASSQLLLPLQTTPHAREVAADVYDCAARLAREVRVQKILSQGPGGFSLSVQDVSVEGLLKSVADLGRNHPAAASRTVRVLDVPAPLSICTDSYLLERVLLNMVVNAVEASDPGEEIRLQAVTQDERVTFTVWNRRPIPPAVQNRIFQRNFTTKSGSGRGLGTYAMRLLGETFLGGKIEFSSSPSEGTFFRLTMPQVLPDR